MNETEKHDPLSSRTSRRDFVKAALGASVAATGLRNGERQVEAEPTEGPTLREIADRKNFHIGGLNLTASSAEELNFNLTNAVNWKGMLPLSRNPEDIGFDDLDRALSLSKENNIHAGISHILWGYNGSDNSYIPTWLPEEVAQNGGDLMPSLNAFTKIILNHSQEAFPGTVDWAVVAHEPLNFVGGYEDFQTPSILWSNYFNNASTEYYGDPRAWITESFKTANEVLQSDEANQKMQLLINEWGAEQPYTSKGEGYLQLVQFLAEQGIPMDNLKVGFQMHLYPGQDVGNGIKLANSEEIQWFASNFRDHALRFPALPVVTEMDINIAGWNQMGYSPETIRQLTGETYGAISNALIEAGGKDLMLYNSFLVLGRFKDEPGSAYNQLREVLETKLPNVNEAPIT